MALFGKKTKTEEPIAAAATAPAVVPVPQTATTAKKHAGAVLLSPRVTEKGAYLGQEGVYVFNVVRSANKQEIAKAVKEVFGVTPRQVRIAAIPRKSVLTRGTNRTGKTAGGKKAYVYLKEGDTIELV
jgi:large subunit ribosomal protein L23